jgi:hypothetical protein
MTDETIDPQDPNTPPLVIGGLDDVEEGSNLSAVEAAFKKAFDEGSADSSDTSIEEVRGSIKEAQAGEAASEAEVDEESAEEGDDTEDQGSDVSLSDAQKNELARAYNQLRYAKIDSAKLEALDPETVLAMAENIRTANSETKKALQELAEAKKAQPTQTTGEPATPDLDEALKPFEEEFGEGASKAMKALLSLQQRESKALRAELQEVKERATATPAVDGNRLIEEQMRRLEPDYPELATNLRLRGEVIENAELLAMSGRFNINDANTVFDKALLMSGAASAGEGRSSLSSREITNGQPTKPKRRSSKRAKRPKDMEDAIKAAFEVHMPAFRQGDRIDPREAAKRAGLV